MQDGVVVMLDALGFKGIWKPGPGETEDERALAVLTKMTTLREIANGHRGDGPNAVMRTHRECISDTIVIGVWPTDSTPAKELLPITFATTLASIFCFHAAKPPIQLAYRGAMAAGRFEIRDGFVIGPAVDEAASCMELAEGAFIWMTPSALALAGDSMAVAAVAHRHVVPLKGGASFDTFVVRPWLGPIFDSLVEQAKALLATFCAFRKLCGVFSRNSAVSLNVLVQL